MEPIWYLLGFNVALFAALMLSGRISSRTTGKRTLRRLLIVISIVLLFGAILPEQALATFIIERTLPTDATRGPFGIDVARNGSFVVFAEKHYGRIGFMGTGHTWYNGSFNGKFIEFPLPGSDGPSAEPRDVALGNATLLMNSPGPKEGFVFFTEFVRNRIGRLSLASSSGWPFGRIDEFNIPTPNSGPMNLAIDPYNGSIWFTEYQTNKIGRLFYTGTGNWKFIEYSLPTTNSFPTDIAVDPNYWYVFPAYNATFTEAQTYIWFTMSGIDMIGRLNGQTGEIVQYQTRGTPWGITVTPQSFVWFTQKLGDRIARLHPYTGMITEVPLPVHSPGNEPLYIKNDTDGSLWFTESVMNIVGRYIPGQNVFQEFVVPTTAAKPHGLAITQRLYGFTVQTSPVNYYGTFSVFFGEEVGNKIGEIILPSGPWTTTTTVGYVSSVTTTTSSATTLSTAATSTTSNNPVPGVNIVPYVHPTYTNITITLTDTISILQTSTTSTWTTTTTSTSTTTTTSTSSTVSTTTSTTPTTTTVSSTTTSTISSTTTTTTSTSTTYTSTSYSPTITTTTTVGVLSTFSTTTTTTTTGTLTQPLQMFTTTVVTTTMTVTSAPVSRACIIASAAYGSELAPPVQFLREFRDHTVMSTFAGAQFMQIFNAFYYSFSPTVAGFTASSPILQAAVRVLIYPLIASLHFAATLCQICPQGSQLMVLFAGTVASGLVGIVYASPVVIALKMIRRRMRISGGM